MYAKDPLAGAVAEGFKVRDDVYKTASEEMAAADRGAISAKGFELSARRIGRLMREQYNLGFVDVGGWDTHVGQGGATGAMANRLGELGRGLAGFAQELGPDAWNNAVVVVISEFGRTFQENGNGGTDHRSRQRLLGARRAVKGGQIAGDQVKVERATMFQNRDYPVLTDYRALFGGLSPRLWARPEAACAGVSGNRPEGYRSAVSRVGNGTGSARCSRFKAVKDCSFSLDEGLVDAKGLPPPNYCIEAMQHIGNCRR